MLEYQKQIKMNIDEIHQIFKSEEKESLEDIKKSVEILLKKEFQTNDILLNTIHEYCDKSNVNNIRLKVFRYLNTTNKDWAYIIKKIAGNKIISMIGPDYLIQKQINVSIQMPNDETSLLPIHSDCISGDSPWQLNLWIPLTDAWDTNSMFIVKKSDSLDFIKKLQDAKNEGIEAYKKLKETANNYNRQFVEIKYGSLLLFNPAVLHGNEINRTESTRVSLNIRLKSTYTPGANKNSSGREIGVYYKVANETENSRFSRQMQEQLGWL